MRVWLTRGVCACIAGLALLAGGGALAQERVNGEVDHWALAPFLGTGAYAFDSEQSIYVFEYTPRWTWRTETADGSVAERAGIDVLVPATLGLRSFDLGDLPETLDPGNVATFSVVPGIYATLPMGPRWTLLGIANLGLGARLDGEEMALIHRLGIRSRTRFGDDDLRWSVIAALEQIGYNTDTHRSDRILPASLTLQAEFPVSAWAGDAGPTDLVVHLTGSHYLSDLSIGAIEAAGAAIRNDLEFGIAVHPAERIRWWRLSWERIGLAYRRGKGDDGADFEGVRLYFRSVFDQ